jgi:hypothetical protein
MAIVILQKNEKLSKEQFQQTREEYDTYIKITADLKQEIIALGGEYHADCEKILVTTYGSKNSDVWGGGYDLENNKFETNAMINIKPLLEATNANIENQETRNMFLTLVTTTLDNIESLQ